MEQTTSEKPATVEYSFEFRGNIGEFFKIWIVNMMLTVVTLGVFSAWAKVRTRRYFNGNTFLDGGNFDYHANPWSILIARVLVLGAIGIAFYWAGENVLKNAVYSTLLVVFLPWAYVRGLAFNARNTSFHGLRFSFAKTYGVMYAIYLPIIIAVLAPAYYFAINYWGEDYPLNYPKKIIVILFVAWGGVLLLFPLMVFVMHRFRAYGHSFGALSFDFRAPSVWRYYSAPAIFFVAVLVTILIIMLLLYLFLEIIPPDFIPSLKSLYTGFSLDFIIGMAVFIYFYVIIIIPFVFDKISFDFKMSSVWRYYVVLAGVLVAVPVAVYVVFLLLNLFSATIYPLIDKDASELAFMMVFFAYFSVIVIIIPFVMALYFRLFWNNLTFPNGKVQCDFPVFQFALRILTVNYLAIGFSLGLLYPWAKIRRARYLAEHIKIIAPAGALQEVIAARKEKEGALGEELSTVEGFDFDIGLI